MTPKLTRMQGIIVSAYTGILICDFGDMHEEVEKRLGRPVWTHQFPSLRDEIAAAFKDDFVALLPAGSMTPLPEKK